MVRPSLDKHHPDVFTSYLNTARTVRSAARAAGLDRRLLELVNLRASQINACAYCLDVHAKAALDNGETYRRITLLPAWRESNLFDAREKAALALTEAVTVITDERGRDEAFARAAEHFTKDQISALNWTAITINAFNRVSVLSQHKVRRED
ncbi:carboxymuconolactone decarboxylase family protein [Hoyosella sp. YIM 151337]|uniref:carboxymuconolactone decarboxylase family protein n=1 Tax=Hoyosella sp. YIM 151337 TaxID=2992742 RepID=UPI002236878E|nr:carboxymuconolactone decarboxylase family protein [Hoyosella sp. YIM 151337]MCW4354416.1 carboxymuconolactone decarboxylase family protein [Hoyosella sp. YIM 151337]